MLDYCQTAIMAVAIRGTVYIFQLSELSPDINGMGTSALFAQWFDIAQSVIFVQRITQFWVQTRAEHFTKER